VQVPRPLINNPKLVATQKKVAAVTLLVPLMGAALYAYWYATVGVVTVVSWWSAAALYGLTIFGISVGFHRLFAHHAFKTGATTRALIAVSGMMAAQGPVLFWVSNHRRHHAYSDTPGDCHSPCTHGESSLARLSGLWHAHVGWMLGDHVTSPAAYAKDLCRDRTVMKVNRLYFLWVMAGLALPALVSGLVAQSWQGALEGLLLGGLTRICAVHHVTWGVNSLAHVLGARRYESEDNSRNLAWLALLTMGEGWHNNHHAFPASARFGHKWHELDVGYALIRLMQLLGICTEVQLPRSSRVDHEQSLSTVTEPSR
jgi:stearoyl-CoA desaturase (Delta-9 desaturase)